MVKSRCAPNCHEGKSMIEDRDLPSLETGPEAEADSSPVFLGTGFVPNHIFSAYRRPLKGCLHIDMARYLDAPGERHLWSLASKW
jgi:hypothetical protein